MKRDKLILLKNALRFYFLCTILFFGSTLLIKHYIFHYEMDHQTITDNLFSSLFTSIIFTIVFRSKWQRKDTGSIFNSPDPKTDS